MTDAKTAKRTSKSGRQRLRDDIMSAVLYNGGKRICPFRLVAVCRVYGCGIDFTRDMICPTLPAIEKNPLKKENLRNYI